VRILLPVFGFPLFLFLLSPGEAHAALPTPPLPPVIARPYLDQPDASAPLGLFQHIKKYLDDAQPDPPTSCAADEKIRLEAETARALRDVLFDLRGGVIEPQLDLGRTACVRADAEALEGYIRALSELALQSARDSCDMQAAAHYLAMVEFVWNTLRGMRRFGLDPATPVPLAGTGALSPPGGATAASDDDHCLYDSRKAGMQFGGLGCQDLTLPSATPSFRLFREARIFESLRKQLDINLLTPNLGLATQLRTLRKMLDDIRKATDTYVSSLMVKRPPGTSSGAIFTFTPFVAPNANERGCLGWPSEVGGTVSGKDVSLQEGFPFLLTQELRETFAYLRMRENDSWLEYERALTDEQKANEEQPFAIGGSFLPNLNFENRTHLRLESFAILTIRDPQDRMEEIGDRLHERTREFASFATNIDAKTWAAPAKTPPLRAFAQAMASFLSRMCVNRGCEEPLLRVTEMSLRDECFSTFLMHLFFKGNPNAATLPACRAIYAE
jgi:hypothetical protein